MRDDIRFILGEISRIEDEIEALILERDQFLYALDRLIEVEMEESEERTSFAERYGAKGFRRDIDRFFGKGLQRDVDRFFGTP